MQNGVCRRDCSTCCLFGVTFMWSAGVSQRTFSGGEGAVHTKCRSMTREIRARLWPVVRFRQQKHCGLGWTQTVSLEKQINCVWMVTTALVPPVSAFCNLKLIYMSTSFWDITKEPCKSAVVATNQTHHVSCIHGTYFTCPFRDKKPKSWLDGCFVCYFCYRLVHFLQHQWSYLVSIGAELWTELLSEYAKIAARPPSFTTVPPPGYWLVRSYSNQLKANQMEKDKKRHFRLDISPTAFQKTKTELITSMVRITCVQELTCNPQVILTSSFSSLSSHNLPHSTPTTHL